MTFNLNPDRYPPSDSRVGAPLANTTAEIATRTAVVVGSPEWWLERLLARLVKQLEYARSHWGFYEGRQPLAFASDKFQAAYAGRYRSLPANFMPLVIDAERERLIVQGFRFGGKTESDKAVWRIWQGNDLDAESQIAHEITLAKGVSYTLVTPRAGDVPLITIEDPEQMVVETLPGNRRIRLAALKVWRGDDGYLRAYLYLPDAIYKWRSRETFRSGLSDSSGGHSIGTDGVTGSTSQAMKAAGWVPELPVTEDGVEDFPIPNPIGKVPVVPLLNRPTLEGHGRCEFAPVIGNQNAINFLRFAALVGSDVAVLPQRWAKNLDLEVDGDTGAVKVPFRIGVDNLWTTRRPTSEETAEYADKFPETEFGQFPGATLEPFVRLIQEEVSQMASISRTPYHYLLGTPQSVPPTGESIKSSEAPLVKKVIAEAVHLGEGWEETMRLALIASNQTAKARSDAETMWTDPETRNEGARTDAIIKQYQVGLLPDQFALEQLGYSAQEIERIQMMKAAEKAAEPEESPIEPPDVAEETAPDAV